MGTRTTDCRKFTPNIFNKSKCSHCFRQREEHSAAALESNRASRKVSKCGYLFVAPDWDFNNPLYRTKRWQRRWFVLYDDGELTYSVDEHPETVPQASIDMTKVLEVTTAEEVTGHTNSIAITAPDRVTFVKGTCPEEAKWWLNILVAFPKTKGRHKRNATFPGGQATTIIQKTTAPNSRNRHNSYHKDTLSSGPVNSLDVIGSTWDTGTQNPAITPTGQDENNKNAGNEITNRVYTDQPVSSKSPPTRDKIHPESKAQVRIRNRSRTTPSIQDDSEPVSSCLLIEDVRRDEKLKDIANTITNLSHITNNRWATTTTTPTTNNSPNNQSSFDDKPTRDETDFLSSTQDFHKVVNLRPKSLPLASSTAPAIVSAIVKKIPPVASDIKSSPRLHSLKQTQQQNQSQERGDPDGGCNLDDISSNYLSKNSELRVNLPAEELLNSKKGWLMKQDSRTGEWTKHWFTLRGAALFYYRDPVSEERGVLDGVLDVNSLTSVSEIAASRNYGFQLTTWDNRRIVLASVSANSRNNWINVLRNAAGIQIPPEPKAVDDMEPDLIIKDNTSDDLKSEIEKDFIKAQRNQEIIINNLGIHENPPESSTIVTTKPTATTSVTTPKPVNVSSDEEYRTASEGGRRDSIDWGSPLSPSPPIPLAIFRAKERMRSRSGSSPRLHKRSRSSPPSSRRSTVDSVGSDELPLIHPVQEELNIDKELQLRLGAAEKERDMLREEAREREARMSELLSTLERTELELTARIREVEEARDNLSRQLAEANCKAEQIVSRLTSELEESQKKIRDLEDRLSRGIEENEGLYKKLRELEGCSPSSFSNLNRSKMRRVDSLSDLTNLTEIDPYGMERDMLADEYNELRSRFEKAVNEIKAMKKELRESQNQFDTLEISYAALKQDLERKESEDRCQLQMMAERIQDLTLKYTSSERQVRTLKQKLAKSERRRSSSLKGKEQVLVPKELEEKVSELENKIADLEKSSSERHQSEESSVKRVASNPRRRSLESSATADSLQFMVRLNALEKRIDNASTSSIPEGNVVKSNSSPKMSEHLVERLKCLEGVLVSSKDRIEQSLQQLQSLRSSRARRSVSPITDRKDSFRFVERCLTEVVKLIRESCETCIVSNYGNTPGVLLLPESNPIKLALMQLEAQLRSKLSDLLKQRRVLRERNELTSRKEMELLAERIAFESVCFGKLRESISRAEDPSLFGERQTKAEVAETSQLMSMLKAKLGGKCAFKPTGSLDILAGVLARRLVLSSYRKSKQKVAEMAPVDPKVIEELLRQQTEINIISKRYKNNAMETLASGLAAETLSYMSSTDPVQGAVQEAWRQAQETVNAELVQSEIAHIMMRNAERFENSITPSFGYTLTVEERITFENFADAVHDTLRREMDNAIEQLTRCYEESLQKMKRGQWRLHLEQERKASEGRQLLSEFADIIAHKALVDARIAVLKGDYASQGQPSDEKSDFSIGTLQKYENLFDELANDLQISNPDDILAEADFNFMYKKFAIEFLSDKPHLKEVSEALAKLEESIILLHSTLNPNTSMSSTSFDVENLKDICIKCRELRKRIDGMIGCAQKLVTPCEHCEKMQNSICSLTAQHETEIRSLQQVHDKDLTALRKQLEEHVNSIKALENERNSLLEELTLQSNLVEDHERELAAITLKLKCKEEECHRKDTDNVDLTDRLEDQESKIRCLESEKESLSSKCMRQDEEYAALLQERDYIQSELNKERERSRKLEKRLEMLEIEHTRQLECLQEAYRDQILSHCSDFTGIADEESFRQRYQTEIEQLRTLCEKGLAAMESSHRRIINDLEEKHRKEIERLLIEKEQALAEETQATLAALDAMRKAHQSEVQREVARFKQDFLRQFQKGEQSAVSTREKEEELEELRQEILSFSEKYSIKCVENAALEERLRAANQKLKQFQQMQQLELRNKQFRAHLASEDPSDLNFVQGLTKDDMPCPDSEHERDEFVVNTVPSCVDSPTLDSCDNKNHHTWPVSQNNCKKEIHPRSGFSEGVKLTTIYSDITKPTHTQISSTHESTDQTRSALSRQTPTSPTTAAHDPPIDRQRTDRSRSSESEPVEQPKTSKILTPKSVNMKLVNLKINEPQQNNKKPQQKDHLKQGESDRHRISEQTTGGDHSNRNEMVQKRLAVSLSSLSELLNPNNSYSKSRRSNISDIIINNTNNHNHNHSINNSNTNSCSGSTVMCSGGRAVIDHLKSINGDTLDTKQKSSVDCRFDHNTQLESVAMAKRCSPPPLSGRDVEPVTTSHLRRFELEI